jgi:hypothetical protein
MPILRKKDGKPATWAAKPRGPAPRGGEYVQTKDGKWVLKLGKPERPATPSPPATIEPGGSPPAKYAPGGPPDFGYGAASSPEAQAAIADLIAQFKTQTGGTLDDQGNFIPGETGGTIGAKFDSLQKQLEARRPLIKQAQREGLQQIASDMAARGTIRSGLKELDDQRVKTDGMVRSQETERLIQEAAADKASALHQAAARLLQGRKDIETRAGAGYMGDRIGNFEDTYGGDDEPVKATLPGGPDAPPGPRTVRPIGPRRPVSGPRRPGSGPARPGARMRRLPGREWDRRVVKPPRPRSTSGNVYVAHPR